jgi:hypothetical protein
MVKKIRSRGVGLSWLALCMVGALLCLNVSAVRAGEKAPKKLDMRKVLRVLESRNASHREAALEALMGAGDDGALALSDAMEGKSSSVRQRYLEILMKMDGSAAKIAVAKMAVFEKNRNLREKAVDGMLERHDKDVRAYLLGIVETKATGTRQKAAEAIRETRDPVYVDALLAMLRKQLAGVANSGSQGDFSIGSGGGFNLGVSRDNAAPTGSRTVTSRVNGKTVTQKSTGPIFPGAGSSTAGLPAAQALVTITGRNYGSNYKRWEAWWKENREAWAAGRR